MATTFSVPSGKEVHLTRYQDFKGVDFKKEDTVCDNYHFPYAQNLIISKDGLVEKRPGWRKLCGGLGDIHSMKEAVIGDVSFFVLHIGTKLYKLVDTQLIEIKTKNEEEFLIDDCESVMFFM